MVLVGMKEFLGSQRKQGGGGLCTVPNPTTSNLTALPATNMEVDDGRWNDNFPLQIGGCPLPCLFHGLFIVAQNDQNSLDGAKTLNGPWKKI